MSGTGYWAGYSRDGGVTCRVMDRGGKMTTEELKARIDAMSHRDLCRIWRFAPSGDPLFQGEVGEYFVAKLREKGGMTPEISKSLGWQK